MIYKKTLLFLLFLCVFNVAIPAYSIESKPSDSILSFATVVTLGISIGAIAGGLITYTYMKYSMKRESMAFNKKNIVQYLLTGGYFQDPPGVINSYLEKCGLHTKCKAEESNVYFECLSSEGNTQVQKLSHIVLIEEE